MLYYILIRRAVTYFFNSDSYGYVWQLCICVLNREVLGQGKGGILLAGKGLGGRDPILEHLGRERYSRIS